MDGSFFFLNFSYVVRLHPLWNYFITHSSEIQEPSIRNTFIFFCSILLRFNYQCCFLSAPPCFPIRDMVYGINHLNWGVYPLLSVFVRYFPILNQLRELIPRHFTTIFSASFTSSSRLISHMEMLHYLFFLCTTTTFICASTLFCNGLTIILFL